MVLFNIISCMINASASFILSFFVYFKNPHKNINKRYFFFGLSVGLWALSYFFWHFSKNKVEAIFFVKILLITAMFVPATFLHFVLEFTDEVKNKKYLLLMSYFMSSIFMPLVSSGYIIKGVSSKLCFEYWPTPYSLFTFFLIYFVSILLYADFLLYLYMKKTKESIKREQTKYMLLGTFIGSLGGVTNYLLYYDILIAPFGNVLVSLYVICIAYAIIRHHLMDIEVVIKKTIIFSGLLGLLYVIVTAITFVAKNAIGHYVIVSQDMATLIIIVIILIFDGPLKKILINLTENFLFQKEYNHQQVSKEITRGMIGKVDLEELKEFISTALLEKMKLENIAIVNKDELQQIKSAISVPIYLKDEVFWTLLLGDKKSGKIYTKEDENMLDALSNEVSIAVENAINFQHIKEAHMELMRQDNLKFISVLVKGLAHEIFNPLTPLIHRIEDLEGESLLEIYEIYENNKDKFSKEEKSRFKEAILALRESTKSLKTNASHIQLIVDTLSKLEKGDDKTIGPVDIKTFLKEIFTMFGFEVDSELQKDVIVNQDIDKNLPPVNGNPTLLKQIFINLYKNACYAMKSSENKIINVSCKINESKNNEVLIEFSDTGSGIPHEILPKLFTYGFSTKGSRGSGIGLNQCKAMVEKFGGFIKVESEKGKGTRFLIGLPVYKEAASK